MKHALILGVGGQDGSYLCEHLLSLGYRVTGTYRRSSVDNLWRIEGVRDHERLNLFECDIADAGSMRELFDRHPPDDDSFDEVYNLADQDHVASSLKTPDYSANVTYGGPARLFEMLIGYRGDVRVFQPSSATIFGDQHTHPCDENSDYNPQSPYAVAKLGALYLARYYRSRGLRVWCGILYGHASIRQKPEYLVHRIAKQAVEVTSGKRLKMDFRDTGFRVDVGMASEFVRGYHAMIQTEKPDDYVMSTGKPCMVQNLCTHALYEAGAEYTDGFMDDPTDRERCVVGNATKALDVFGWRTKSDAFTVVGDLVDFYSQETR